MSAPAASRIQEASITSAGAGCGEAITERAAVAITSQAAQRIPRGRYVNRASERVSAVRPLHSATETRASGATRSKSQGSVWRKGRATTARQSHFAASSEAVSPVEMSVHDVIEAR